MWAPHDELIHDLAAASRGGFAPEAVFQLRGAGDDTYQVQFVHCGRLYRILIAEWGDRYDAATIVAAANVALGDAGETRRFVAPRATVGYVDVIFVDPERLRAIAPEIGLEPGAIVDPDLAAAEALEYPSSQRLRSALRELLSQVDPDLGDAAFARATGA